MRLGDTSSVGRRGADDDGPLRTRTDGYQCSVILVDERDALGFGLLGHLCLELVNRLERFRVSVCTFDEGCSLAFKDGLSALKVGVDQADDLESRTELVFESERVAKENIVVSQCVAYAVSRLHLLPGSFLATKHDVLRSS